MSSFRLAEGDDYDKKCGEVFLTKYGNVIFHCSMCENKFTGFQEYTDHLMNDHYDPNFSEEDFFSTEYSTINEDDIKSEVMDEEYLDEALQEVEVPILLSKEKKKVSQVVTNSIMSVGLPALDESKPNALTFKWEEPIQPVTEFEKIRQKKDTHSSSPKETPKPITMAEKLRKLNETALLNSSEMPLYKQPRPRGQIPDSERQFKCNLCGFAFKDKSNLLAHIKRHSESKNYQCEYCTKMFHTRTEIDDHRRRHTGERPFACKICGKTYCTTGERSTHMKRHLNIRKYKCEICDRRFYDGFDLKEHMVVHSQERNHECIVCHAKFPRRKAMLVHMKLHENKREYVCVLCNASFNQKPGLNSHMKSKHKNTG